MKKLITLVVLITLLVTPTLPAFAGGGSPGAAGLLTWLQSWWDGIVSSVTGEAGPKIDPNGLTDFSSNDGNEAGPLIDPSGLADGQATDDEEDGGPRIDPWG